MASRNSHCVARGRGKRDPKIRQIQKIHVFEAFWALFPYKLYRILMVFQKMFFGFGRKKIEKLKIFKIQFDFYFC